MNRSLTTMLILLLASASNAQSNAEDPILRAVEYIINVNDDKSFDTEELTFTLEELLKKPVYINDTRQSALESIPLLSDFQIESIQDYIKQFGPLSSINELQLVPGFDQELVAIVTPFITVVAPEVNSMRISDLKPVRMGIMGRSKLLVQKAEGYKATDNSRFQGSRLYYASSYNLSLGDKVLINLHSEKDAGEKAQSKRLYFDSNSGSITVLTPIKQLSKVIVGDYRINLGQGLISWSSFTTSRPNTPGTLRKRGSITPYKSFDETSFSRGIAVEAELKPIRLAIALSGKPVDGYVSTQNPSTFTLLKTGLHRSNKEIASHAAIKERGFAGKISFQKLQNSINFNFTTKKISGLGLTRVEKGMSIDLYKQWRKGALFGEVASDGDWHLSSFVGSQIKISSRTILTASYRKYSKGFAISGNSAFGENSTASNEEGFYVGFNITPQYRYSIVAYTDMFRLPSPKYRVSKPSNGVESGITLTGLISKNIEARIRYRHKIYEQDSDQESGTSLSTATFRSNKSDIYLKYNILQSSKLTIGASLSSSKQEFVPTRWGYMAFADLQFSIKKSALQLYLRYTTFSSENKAVAQYSYENDLPGMYTSTIFNKKGNRAYIMVKYTAGARLKIWTKISQTFYAPPATYIGDGADRIAGNKKTEVRLQATLDL